ncbi:hypothetical protein Q8A73_000054 [Channa argus]|nr:hypothetical protein Q8A73_000054 [Channa argus]
MASPKRRKLWWLHVCGPRTYEVCDCVETTASQVKVLKHGDRKQEETATALNLSTHFIQKLSRRGLNVLSVDLGWRKERKKREEPRINTSVSSPRSLCPLWPGMVSPPSVYLLKGLIDKLSDITVATITHSR